VVCSYALSGSFLYMFSNMVINAQYMHEVWSKTGPQKARRSRNILIAVFLYTAPVLFRGDWYNYSRALGWFLVGGISFQTHHLGGWGHGVFHLFCIVYCYYLVVSTLTVEGWC